MADKTKNGGLHDGHKKRLREKFEIHDDFSGLAEHEILELVLNYANVRKNTNDTAHELLKKFGSIDAVFDASRTELMTVAGIGENMATYIIMLRALFGIFNKSKYDMKNKSAESDDLIPYVVSLFAGAKKELLYMLCVSSKGRITNTQLVTRGAGSYVPIEPREIMRIAINNDAHDVIFAHNHPTGIAKASQDDIESTRLLAGYLKALGIRLKHHFIVAENECVDLLKDSRFRFYK